METPHRVSIGSKKMGKATQDGRVYMNLRVWEWTRDTLRRCCALQQELDEGSETWSRRPPNGLAAKVLERALESNADRLERECERRRGDMPSDWRENVEAREDRWRRTALGETESEVPQFRSPPPQFGPSIDED